MSAAKEPDLDRCVALCTDALEVLNVMSRALARPFHPARTPGLRQMVEAGLEVALRCAAECERWADRHPIAGECTTACRRCVDALRPLLADLHDESSGDDRSA
jgi:hypothetical protein